jgi:uncharacterized membrane protein YjfL (UPF0719 family)
MIYITASDAMQIIAFMIFHTLDKYNNFTLLGRNASRAARLGPF